MIIVPPALSRGRGPTSVEPPALEPAATRRRPYPIRPRAALLDHDPACHEGGALMTWTNRLRLFVGLLAVIALVAALTLVVNQRARQAVSLTATIGADTLPWWARRTAAPWWTQHVAHGDTVETGQELFTISASACSRISPTA